MTPTPAPTDHELHLARLIDRFLQNKITRAEHIELDQWVGASEENTMTFEALTDPYFQEALLRYPALVEALGRYHRPHES